MPNRSNEAPADDTPTWMAIAGALCVFVFLFLPMPRRWESEDFQIYLASGKAEAVALFLCVPAVAFLIYRKNFIWALGAIAVPLLLLLMKLVFSGLARLGGVDRYSGRAAFGYHPEPGFLHWAILIVGMILLIGAEIYGLLQSSGGRRRPVTISGTQGGQSRATPARPVPVKSARRGAPRFSLSDFFESVDWGFWGIALLSLLFWPLGLLLFFAYSRSGDDKSGAALLGAGLGLGLMVLRFIIAMAKVGAAS